MDKVRCITTPGNTIDVVVTEVGLAVNPLRTDLIERLQAFGLPVKTIQELRDEARRLSPAIQERCDHDQVVAVVEYRDGSVIDVVRRSL